MEKTSRLLREGVDYYQVVFTIPASLSALALGNRREMYDLLFRSAWQALRERIEQEQSYEAAAAMVLHTWNQKLEAHAHVHAVVPGGGPALRGRARWIRSSRPRRRRRRKNERAHYLVDANRLRQRFRECFIAGLRRLHEAQKLRLEGELLDGAAWETLLAKLEQVTWTVYIEPPPTEYCDPQQVVKYLARYLTGGPISDRRLIRHTEGRVTFWARSGEQSGGGGRATSRPYTLSGVEFVRRWSLHVLPKGYVKTRRFGGYSPRHLADYLRRSDELLGQSAAAADPPDAPHGETEPVDAEPSDQRRCRCPNCDRPMQLRSAVHRPAWSRVMGGADRPKWYRDD